MSSPLTPPTPLIAILGMVVGACTTEKEAPRTVTAGAPNSVSVSATDYAFQAPDTIPPGWTTFRLSNSGATTHMAQLVKLEQGRTLDEFKQAYHEAWRTVGPRPAWGKRFGGPGAAEPGGSANATMYLEPGSYGWYCPMNIEDGVPHIFGKGMARPFVVREGGGDSIRQAAPEPTVTIRLRDYSFSLSGTLTAGHHVFRVQNEGAEPHELGLMKLSPGKTWEDFEAWTRSPTGPAPATVQGGVAALAPLAEAYFDAALTPGQYTLFCFVTAPDGRPHTEHGMIQHLRIE